MNIKALAICGLASVIGIGAAFGVSAQTGAFNAPDSADRVSFAQRERHPEMTAALRALRTARERLERADHDFGGHRVKALDHTKDAIREVEEALRYDRK